MKRLGHVLLWSVLSAAFIGPGTITTAASAGALYGPRLLWALAFSTLACFVLQEASARLTVWHNGRLIHDDVEVDGGTRAGMASDERPTGPLLLQDHGNPVRYRNVWVLPR